MPSRAHRPAACLLVIIVALAPARMAGQMHAPASALKAAYLFNFARFVEWPSEALPADAPLTICTGDQAVALTLRQVVNGRSVETHAIVVREVLLKADLRSCHILYAGGLNEPETADLIDRVRGAAVMTVSDHERFTTLGGVAHLFIEGGRMGVAINRAAAERAGLRVSSRLMALAKLVS